MQPVQMAQQRSNYCDRRFALLQHPAENAFDPSGVALGRRHHRIGELERRGVADRELRILEFDLPAIAGVEDELFELRTGQQTIAAEVLDEELAGVAVRGHAMSAERLAD